MPIAWLAVLICRCPPCRSFNAKQGFAHRLADQIAERETDIALPTGVREIVARPGGIRARENLPIKRVPRQLPKRQIERLDVIVGVVRPGVPRPQDPGGYHGTKGFSTRRTRRQLRRSSR